MEKDDLRIELNGEMDELNALLGLCKAQSGQQEPFETLQRQLTDVMTIVASNGKAEEDTCERRFVTLDRQMSFPEVIRIYLNRLSDYLFSLILEDVKAE